MAVFPVKCISQTIPYIYEEPSIAISDYRGWPPAPKKEVPAHIFYDSCVCVSLSKVLAGFNGSVGLARNWPTNSKIPKVGEVVILNESPAGHSAYITHVWVDEFEVDETNYIPCQRSSRIIKNNDKDIIGYYEQ